MHLIAQFGHLGLMHTMLRIASKANMAKFLMMFDRQAPASSFIHVLVSGVSFIHVLVSWHALSSSASRSISEPVGRACTMPCTMATRNWWLICCGLLPLKDS